MSKQQPSGLVEKELIEHNVVSRSSDVANIIRPPMG